MIPPTKISTSFVYVKNRENNTTMIKILHISIDKVPYDAEKTCLPRIQDSNPRLDTRAHIFLNLFQILTIDYAPKRKTQGLPCILYFFI
jgi:hypothetical protein